MSRYIDADAVITAIAEFNKYEDELEYPYASDDLEEYKDDARLLIEDAPSIDIVRCGECKYYTKRKFTDGSGEIWAEDICDHYNLTAPMPDDFCSYGERKESE